MHLIIDAGNTRIKLAVFNNDELIHNEIITYLELEKKAFFLIEKYKISEGIISSVGDVKKDVFLKIESKIKLLTLTSEVKIPFKNNYSTPKTLGVDRIALAAAAATVYPNKNVLVIDAGTCITYDFVNTKKQYLGGAISPGLKMRYKSLNYYTEKLPKLTIKYPKKLIGDSTNECMHVGVSMAVINEIDNFIDLYREKNENLTVVLTGGDINFLSNSLKNSIFAIPNFLLLGLNSILTYNIK